MSATGRPAREYLRSQHEGTPVSAPGRPERARNGNGATLTIIKVQLPT
jgi:hypothetical protein